MSDKPLTQPPSDSPLAVRTRGLGKRFGRQWALAHFDLDVPAGQVVLLAGANGSGKTTLLRLIAGLYRPNRGELTVFGKDPGRERLECRRYLTMVAHDSYLYDRLSALETLRVWSRLRGGKIDDGRLLGLLREVDLDRRPDVAVGGFSAGMRKRLTLLRTKLEEPRLVLLDEPFSALDTAGQKLVESWILDCRERGIAVLLASHDLPRASRLSDRAVYLKEGQTAWQGPSSQLLDHVGAPS